MPLVTVHNPPVRRAYRTVGIGLAPCYPPLMEWALWDAPVIAALTTFVAAKSRWSF